jgi:aspartokinase-like uncharacterized kinase
MNVDAILKVGGSLHRSEGLPELCREIVRIAGTYRLLIVPGGGIFADQVREIYRRYFLNETAAHRMALLAMDQYGYLLHHLITGSSLAADFTSAERIAGAGRPGILLPSALVNQEDELPHSWEVTSDSIAAWIARKAQCRRLILLKDVDGLLTAANPPEVISDLTVRQLAGHDGGVDRYLRRILDGSDVETWIINGLIPERLSELLQTAHTVGTRIQI